MIPLDQNAHVELLRRNEELRCFGNVYAMAGDPPPADMEREYRAIAEELKRRQTQRSPEIRRAG